jgi:hypothetical protein
MFDTITAVATPFTELESSHNLLDILNFLMPLTTVTVSGTTFADAFWRTLVADGDKLSSEWDSERSTANPMLRLAFGEWLVLAD